MLMAMTKTEFAINDLTRSVAILENRADTAGDTLADLKTSLRHDLDGIKGD
jgi:hypothetical protein